MNNDNDLNLHSMTKLSGWHRYCAMPIDIYLSGLLARNARSQDGGNMRVIANGVNR